MRREKLFFVFIIIIAVFLRFYNLSSVPPHPSLDEVSIGYNALSILNTGRDEFGNFMPLLLRAYDDYRPAHYTYLVIPFIKLFGLNILSVRLPSVLLSIATLVSVYFLILALFNKFKDRNLLAITTISLLAISPWHVYISRLGHEVNLFFSTFIFGITFFYLFLEKKKSSYLIISSLMLALSFSSYQSGKIFIPVIMLVLVGLYIKELLKNKTATIMSIGIFALITVPVIVVSTASEALVRFQATNIYNTLDPYLASSAKNIMEAKEKNDIFSQFINNRRFVYILLPATAYISHFNPFWLAFNTSDEIFKAPGLGLLYFYELPLILLGIIYLWKLRIDKRIKTVIFVWLFSSILPAAITTGFPHAMRVYQVLPVPHILAALGFMQLYTWFGQKKIFLVCGAVIAFASLLYLFNSYFYRFPKETAHQFQYGVIDAMKYVKENEGAYKNIYISNKDNLFQSYMFYLFGIKYDPQKYLASDGTRSGGFAAEHIIGKYYFGDIKNKEENGGLFVINPTEGLRGKIIKKIYSPNGREMIWIIEK